MVALAEIIEQVVHQTGFSGVVRVDRDGETLVRAAYGLADRRHGIAMTPDTQLAMASGSKALTALTVLRLVEEGRLALTTTARSILGDDLPMIADDVTVEHLLGHRSGIGDYLDEDTDLSLSDYLMPVSVHRLATTADYLPLLDGHPAKFPAGQRFCYCNGSYVILALIIERAGGTGYHDAVQARVSDPAGLIDTAFLRSDDLPGRAAVGYVEIDGQWRSNVFHLPVRGNGDGGAYSTVDDLARFWAGLLDGRIVSPDTLAEMVRPRDPQPPTGDGFGLGFWLQSDGALRIQGCDTGASFRSVHDRDGTGGYTVIANTSDGAWPLVRTSQPGVAYGLSR